MLALWQVFGPSLCGRCWQGRPHPIEEHLGLDAFGFVQTDYAVTHNR